MTRFVNVVLVLSLVAALGSVGAASATQTSRPSPTSPAVMAALRDGGLRAAAAASGGEYVGSVEWFYEEFENTLESLARRSHVVLIGELGENRAHLSASGEYITTDYRMTVERSLKGGVSPQSSVVFRVMGGRVVFEDGSSASIETKGLVRPNNGARVVIFGVVVPDVDRLMTPALREYANGALVFDLVGWGRGVYELPSGENDRIRMNAIGPKDRVAERLRGLTGRQFIDELERAVKGPRPTK